MKVVQIGAGRIGRGFLGQLYARTGYEIVFADIDQALIARLNEHRSYPLRLVDVDGSAEDITIDHLRAVSMGDPTALARELADADLAAISVGASELAKTAPVVARGIEARRETGCGALNILLCENLRHAAGHMKAALIPYLGRAAEYAREQVGLVDMVVGRMVPEPTKEMHARDPLLLVAEPYGELLADRDAFKGPVPSLSGMEAVAPIDAYFVRKLFTLNTAHAALAYLGYPRYETIWQCVQDQDVRQGAASAIAESASALAAQYCFSHSELRDYGREVMRRFANEALGDTVARVAADPMRKLSPDDRLVGPALLCERHGIGPTALAHVIDAALRYDNPVDPKAVAMQQELRALGRRRFLMERCGIAPDTALGKLLNHD